MLKREAVSHFLVTIIWLALVTLLRWQWGGDLIFLWLGGLLGTVLLDLDHLLYVFIHPQELTSLRVKRLLGQHRFWEALVLLADTVEERKRLSFHNALFQPLLYGLCFFVLTSTGSLFGAGLVMALALHLLKDEIELLLKGKEDYLRGWLFWPVRKEISLQNQRFFIILMLLIFLVLNLLLV